MRSLPFRAMNRTRQLLVAVFAFALLLVAAPVAHAGYRQAISDCADDGILQGTYKKAELEKARKKLPSDLREYSDCEEVLSREIASLAKKGKGARGGGAVAPPAGDPNLTTPSGAVANNPQQLDELKEKQSKSTDERAPEKVAVGGQQVTPGGAVLKAAAARTSPNELPESLLIALAALAVLGALAGILVLRHRWPETRRVAHRILRR